MKFEEIAMFILIQTLYNVYTHTEISHDIPQISTALCLYVSLNTFKYKLNIGLSTTSAIYRALHFSPHSSGTITRHSTVN